MTRRDTPDLADHVGSRAGARALFTGSMLVYALLGLMPSAASAQTAETAENTETANTQDAAGLEGQDGDDTAESGEIVVTAQRRVQALGDVPISVNVVSGDTIRDRNIVDLKDMATQVPSLTVAETPGQNQVVMRGLGTGARNLLFEQAVTMQVDGLTASRAAQFAVPFFDVERVEVLRGPQGVLYGKNSTAGAINIITANPTSRPSGAFTGRYEFENEGFGVEGYISGPVSDTFGVRVAVKQERLGGYLRDTNLQRDAGQVDTVAVRGTFEWEPSADLTARLKLDYGNVQLTGNILQIGACTAANRARVLAVSPTEDCRMSDITAKSFEEGTLTKNATALLTADYQMGDHTLTSVSSYSQYRTRFTRDLDYTPANVFARSEREKYHQWFQELRLISPAEGFITYIAGLTGQFQNIEIYDIQDLNSLVLPFTNATTAAFHPINNARTIKDTQQTTKSFSAFAQVTLNVTDALRFIGGARYTTERKEIDYDVTRRLFRTDTVVIAPQDVHIVDMSRRENSFDPQVSVQFDLSPRLMTYLTASIVHKGGGFNIDEFNGLIIANTFVYQPEEARAVEGGLKWSGRGAYLNLAVFNTDFKNLQVSSNDGFFQTVRNAARSRNRGVELDGFWRASPYLTLNGGVAYLDAKFVDYPGGSCTGAEAAAVAPAPCTANLSGRRLVFAPKWSVNATAQSVLPLGGAVEGVAAVTVNHKSSQFSQENNDPVFRIPANTTLDARLGVRNEDDSWGVALLAKNLTNDIVPSFVFPFRGAPGAFNVATPRGRSVYLELSTRF